MERDSILTGLVLAMIVPVLGYMLVSGIFDLLTHFGLMDYVSSTGSSKRQRTLALLGICCTLIPFQWAQRNKYINTMRGIIFPTLIYVGAWIYFYKDSLFVF